MRDLEIDEEFDVPVNINEEEMIDEIIRSEKYDDYNISYDDLYGIISKSLNETIEYYTHVNGKVYVDDWSEFYQDLDSKINSKLED